jgi:hypothetical protein
VHVTAERTPLVAPFGSGVALMAQAVPFHDSASVTVTKLLLTAFPTAVHVEPEHATPVSKVSVEPLGFGVDLIAQVVPFHDSARGRVSKSLLS